MFSYGFYLQCVKISIYRGKGKAALQHLCQDMLYLIPYANFVLTQFSEMGSRSAFMNCWYLWHMQYNLYSETTKGK